MSRFLDIAEEALRHSQGRALTVKQMWDFAERHDLIPPQIAGKTPQQTLKSKLSVDIRREGPRSRFARTGPGKFVLRRELGTREVYDALPPALPGSDKELVACIPLRHLVRSTAFQGAALPTSDLRDEVMVNSALMLLPRSEAESRYDIKQLITYVTVRRGSTLLAYTRGVRSRAESFLKGARCVGFGGHVAAEDLAPSLLETHRPMIEVSAVRELLEELRLPAADVQKLALGAPLTLLGFINDDSSDNGQRHIAVVFEYEVCNFEDWNAPRGGEQSTTRLGWIDPSAPTLDLSEFEYWSQLTIRAFYGGAQTGSARTRVVHKAPLTRPHVVCIVGPVGSGKTVAGALLESEFGYEVIPTGRVLASILHLPPVPETKREDFQLAAGDFISTKSGPSDLARRLAEGMKRGRNYVMDGLRHLSTLRALREELTSWRLCVMYVVTPPEIAFRFFRDRERPHLGPMEFYRIRNADVERGIDDLIHEADLVVYNWGDIESYYEALRAVFG